MNYSQFSNKNSQKSQLIGRYNSPIFLNLAVVHYLSILLNIFELSAMNLPSLQLAGKEASHKPQVLQYKKIHELLGSNRDIIKKLPELLFRHLEYYEKAHLDESAEISRSIEDGNFLEELNNLKQVSFDFVESLALMKKNFTTLLTREEEPTHAFETTKTSNFQVFVAEHCENVVRHHLAEISTIDVQENVPRMERQG